MIQGGPAREPAPGDEGLDSWPNSGDPGRSSALGLHDWAAQAWRTARRSRTPFARFLRGLLRADAARAQPASLWPMPLPWDPDAVFKQGREARRRGDGRAATTFTVQLTVTLVVAVLDFEACGRRPRPPGDLPPVGALNDHQHYMVGILKRIVTQFACVHFSSVDDLGRKAMDIDSYLHDLTAVSVGLAAALDPYDCPRPVRTSAASRRGRAPFAVCAPSAWPSPGRRS